MANRWTKPPRSLIFLMMIEKPRSFGAFWPHYLMAHRDPKCRRLHYIGSTGALLGIILAVALLNPLWFVAGMVFAYAMAWTGHFAVERNRPATFGNPVWSLIGDIRMYFLWLSGRLDHQLTAAEHAVTAAAGGSSSRAGI